MAIFNYIARDTQGEAVQGARPGDSRQDVLVWLRNKGLTAISVDEIKASQKNHKRQTRKKAVKATHLSEFCWQVATMLEGGVPLTDAVQTVAGDMDHEVFRTTLQQIADQMEKGQSFAESVSKFPKIFDRLFCSMILAGETGGAMITTLHRMADHYLQKEQLAKKIKKALTYPAFVISFIVLIVIAVMTFIIPRFRTIFDEMGNELPVFTEAFIGLYDFLAHNVHLIIAGTILLVVTLILWIKTKKGYAQFSKISLATPFIGNILRYGFVVVFCRTLATLLSNGVSILDALTILSGMTKNVVIKTAIEETREQIVAGSNISLSMASQPFFPNLAVKMAQVGEESGSMPNVLDRTSDFFERKVDSAVSAMTSSLEPILIITVGLIVAAIVVALYLPIFTMSDL